MHALIILAGAGQVALAMASLTIPGQLGWRDETARLGDLTRCVFWTYAGYTLGTNLCFGLLSLGASAALLDGSVLARCVCGFMAAYWGVRLLLQFLVFRPLAPAGARFVAAEALLTLLFVYLTGVYATAALRAS